ncbi:MAG: 23S rRNA (guanosine(2251)-2'-O)-methyltransferase RlmB [Pseudomonadota bacterium]
MTASRVFGLHAVRHALERAPERVLALHALAGRDDAELRELLRLAELAGASVTRCDRPALDRLAHGGRHQGIVADVRPAPPLDEHGLEALLDALSDETPLLLALDGVQDPHNLGACLRTADATGVHAVIVPRNRAAGLTAAARKVATGAADSVPLVRVTNLARCLRGLSGRGIRIAGAAEGAGSTWYDTDLTGPLCVVMGGEGKGLRRLTRERCDVLGALPMHGAVESLNVSVATGACLYEALRQRALRP